MPTQYIIGSKLSYANSYCWCGRGGTHLAYKLSGEEQQSTTLIDSDKELLRRVQRKADAWHDCR